MDMIFFEILKKAFSRESYSSYFTILPPDVNDNSVSPESMEWHKKSFRYIMASNILY
jgi:hypothetical protein